MPILCSPLANGSLVSHIVQPIARFQPAIVTLTSYILNFASRTTGYWVRSAQDQARRCTFPHIQQTDLQPWWGRHRGPDDTYLGWMPAQLRAAPYVVSKAGDHISTDIAVDMSRFRWRNIPRISWKRISRDTWGCWMSKQSGEKLSRWVTFLASVAEPVWILVHFFPCWPLLWERIDSPLALKTAAPVGYSVPLWDDEKYAKIGTTLTDNAL
jgi:hypothetical protein